MIKHLCGQYCQDDRKKFCRQIGLALVGCDRNIPKAVAFQRKWLEMFLYHIEDRLITWHEKWIYPRTF